MIVYGQYDFPSPHGMNYVPRGLKSRVSGNHNLQARADHEIKISFLPATSKKIRQRCDCFSYWYQFNIINK